MKNSKWRAWAMCLALFCGLVAPVSAGAAGTGETGTPDNLLHIAAVSGSSGQRKDTGPDKAVDGDRSTYFFANADDAERYLLLDLGKTVSIEQLALFFFHESPAYSILLSDDGAHFEEAVTVTDGKDGKKAERVFSLSSFPPARYVKLLERQGYQINSKPYSFAIYELEVYGADSTTAEAVLERLGAPTLSDDGTMLRLPDSPDPRYQVTLYGCEPRQVIAADGTVSQPLRDTEVSVLYQVSSLADPSDTAKSTRAHTVTVPGAYAPGGNQQPNVVPGLREWQGGEGDFCLNGNSALVLSPQDAAALDGTAGQIASFFSDMLNRPIATRVGSPAPGDVLLRLDPSLSPLGEEGYTLNSGDVFTISAAAPQGVLYGGVSLVQVLWQDAAHTRFPRGQARDYPRYDVRGGLLDIASAYLTPDELAQLSRYMAWFKLNELHLHINDSSTASGKSAFRLACEDFPLLPAADGFYTKETYQALQTQAKAYGIEVVTEIVGPARGACFANAAELPLDETGAFDISFPEAFDLTARFLQRLTDAYLTGDDPFLQGAYYDVGAGIYGEANGPALAQLADALADRAGVAGKQARIWYMNGIKDMQSAADILLWSDDPAAARTAFQTGRGVIDVRRSLTQLSTGGRNGLPDHFDLAAQVDRYAVEDLAVSAGISPADPQTRGAIFCLWNEQASFGGGYAAVDLFDRMKNAVALIAEKTWCGDRDKQTGARFASRFEKVGARAGNADPGRFVASQTDMLVDLDFASNGADRTENGRDGVAEGGATFDTLEGRPALCLDGTGALTLPVAAIGYPYTARIDIFCDTEMSPDTLLYTGADGSFYWNVEETGCLGYRRGDYTFCFDGAHLPAGRWCTLVLTGDRNGTALYIDGKKQGGPMLYDTSMQGVMRLPDCSTFLLPTAYLGKGMTGGIGALTLYNRVLTEQEIAALTPALPPTNVPDTPTEPEQPEPPGPSEPPADPSRPGGGSGGGTGGGTGNGPSGGIGAAAQETPPAEHTVTLQNGTKRTETTETDGTRRISDFTSSGVRIDTLISPEGATSAAVTVPDGAPPLTVTIPVDSPRSGLVPLALLPDGGERVIPKSAVSEEGVAFLCHATCSLRIADQDKTFSDMDGRSWAKDAVTFVAARGLLGGMTETTFWPDGGMSRGMLATVLHRLESCPAAQGDGGFDDLAANRYYSEAAAWAAENELIRGIGPDFAADRPVSREQLVTILHRYAGSPSAAGQSVLPSNAEPSDWALPAVRWAREKGLLTGRPDGSLDLKSPVTRAEAAVMLERLVVQLLAA